jgi:hypothetical protein
LRVSSSSSASQAFPTAGASMLLPLPVQSKAERLAAVAPSLAPKLTSDVRLLAPRPSSSRIPTPDFAPDQLASTAKPGMMSMSPDELQQLVQAAVTSAISASVKPVSPSAAAAPKDVQSVGLPRSQELGSMLPEPDYCSKELPLPMSPPFLDCNKSSMQIEVLPNAPIVSKQLCSAIVQTDGDESPRRAPSPAAQSTRQAINDAYNFSLPPSRHVQVLSVAPGAPVQLTSLNSAGPMEARSVAVMRGQPPVSNQGTLSPGESPTLLSPSKHADCFSPGKVSSMLLAGRVSGIGGSASTLDRKSLSRQFSSQPDPVSASAAPHAVF